MFDDYINSVVYTCNSSWLLESINYIKYNNYTLAEHCNLWRNFLPICDSWASMSYIMNWVSNNQDKEGRFTSVSGPGHWNDPATVFINTYGQTVDETRAQMAMWAVTAAPLFISADLATMRPEMKEILLNKDIIAVNQDPLGKQGFRVKDSKTNGLEILKRELADGSYAMAFVSRIITNSDPFAANFTFEEMRLPKQDYDIQDLYKVEKNLTLRYNKDFEVRVNEKGVKFYKFTPRKPDSLEDESDPSLLVIPLKNQTVI